MFKRRLAVLGAVAVLAITGLAGSAMADEPSPTAGTKVTCTTEDGKTIELTPALPAEESVMVGPDGKVAHLADSDTVKVEKLPDGGVAVKRAEPLSPEEAEKFSKVKKLSPEEVDKLIAAGDIVPAKPAEPASPELSTAPAEDGPAKTVKIICKKPE